MAEKKAYHWPQASKPEEIEGPGLILIVFSILAAITIPFVIFITLWLGSGEPDAHIPTPDAPTQYISIDGGEWTPFEGLRIKLESEFTEEEEAHE